VDAASRIEQLIAPVYLAGATETSVGAYRRARQQRTVYGGVDSFAVVSCEGEPAESPGSESQVSLETEPARSPGSDSAAFNPS
jgi:hypothetical protein